MSLGHTYRLKEDYARGQQVSARWLNTVAKFINSLSGSVTNGAIGFDGERASLTCYGKPHPFAAAGAGVYKINVAAGYVHIDGRGGPTLVAAQDVTVSGDGFVTLRISRVNGACGYVYMATVPNCADAAYWWRIICAVTMGSGGVSCVTAQHQFSNVELGA